MKCLVDRARQRAESSGPKTTTRQQLYRERATGKQTREGIERGNAQNRDSGLENVGLAIVEKDHRLETLVTKSDFLMRFREVMKSRDKVTHK